MEIIRDMLYRDWPPKKQNIVQNWNDGHKKEIAEVHRATVESTLKNNEVIDIIRVPVQPDFEI